MDNIQYITLDVMNNKTNNFVYTKQYDVGREVVFSFTDNGEPISLDGLTVVFSMKKPDGKVVIYSGAENLSVTTTTATLTFTEQMTVLAGKLPYQLSLIDGDENDIEEGTAVIISTVNGYIICDKAAVQNDDIVSTSDGNYVAEATTAHESAESAAQSAKIAQSYAVGGTDYSHDGKSDTMDNAKYYCETVENLYDKLFTATKIVLPANGWSNNEQQVTCEGVVADEDEQLIVVRPFGSSVESYVACGVLCTGQARNQLTFKCTEVPTENLDVYVMIQETINGGISNVIVDGQSVVHGTVAEIDLSGKQDVLTPGNNIQINGSTISATDTTYSDFSGGASGLVPRPQSQSGKFLKDDGTWATPTNTTYSDFNGSAHGLVPKPNTISGKLLSDNGSWQEITGLDYWTETETDIYGVGERGKFTASSGWIFNDINNIEIWSTNYRFEIRKKYPEKPCLVGISWDYSSSAITAREFFFVAPKTPDDYSDGCWWQYTPTDNPQSPYYGTWFNPIYDDTETFDPQTGLPSYRRGVWMSEFSYKNQRWVVWAGDIPTSSTGSYWNENNNFQHFDYAAVGGTAQTNLINYAKYIIDISHAETTIPDVTGISTDNHILYYNDDKEGNYDTQNRSDAVYITKDGVFHGSRFEDEDGNAMMVDKHITVYLSPDPNNPGMYIADKMLIGSGEDAIQDLMVDEDYTVDFVYRTKNSRTGFTEDVHFQLIDNCREEYYSDSFMVFLSYGKTYGDTIPTPTYYVASYGQEPGVSPTDIRHLVPMSNS